MNEKREGISETRSGGDFVRIFRIAVPSVDEKGLDSMVSEHFGRAPYYTLVDASDSGKVLNVEVVPVPFAEHGPGDIPNWLKEQGVDVVLALGMGGKAVNFFQQLGIEVIRGAAGRVGDVINGYLRGTLVTVEWEGGHGEGHGHRH